MEAIIFIGIQASGKSTFYRERFFNTHIRLNLDMLKTRHREESLLNACIAFRQPFVVDNTNITRLDRQRYIRPAREAGWRIEGYYFSTSIEASLARNERRTGKERIPIKGVLGTAARLEIPGTGEGFDRLWYVRASVDGEFIIEEWQDEV